MAIFGIARVVITEVPDHITQLGKALDNNENEHARLRISISTNLWLILKQF